MIGALVSALLVAGPVAAPPEPLARDTIPRETLQMGSLDAARFDSLTYLVLRSMLESAIERRLPTAPLISRAQEGAARRASSARIITVVREHANALSDARDLLGGSSVVDELDAGASALRGGIARDALVAVRAARPTGSVVMPLMVLSDLVSKRLVPIGDALDAVTMLARASAGDDALQELRATVAKNAVRGPGMALDALKRYVKGVGSTSPSASGTGERKPQRPPDL